MAVMRINLLGTFSIFLDDQTVFTGLPTTKPLELFAYLLVHRQRPHLRETIATMLWPEQTSPQSKKNLRKVLYKLQHTFLDTVGPKAPAIVLITHDWIALNPALEFQLDVALFERTYALAQANNVGDNQRCQALEAGVALYGGELLSGLYSDWCLRERERLETMFLELHHELLVCAEQQGAYTQAIGHALAILDHDAANERAHRDLMRLYYLSGNRSAALHQYAGCIAALASELGIRPCRATDELYQQICRDEPAAAERMPAHEGAAMEREIEVQHQLRQWHAELQRMLEQVQDEIQQVERLLKS